MAEETKKVVIPAESKEEALAADAAFRAEYGTQSSTRNEVSNSLHVFKILKGDNKNTRYLAPQLDAKQPEQSLKWFGIPAAFDVLNGFLKRVAQESWLENINPETGVLNLQQFLADIADFTAATMKLKEIDDKLEETRELAERLFMTGDLSNPDVAEQLRAYGDQINSYKAMRDKRSRKGKESTAEAAVQVV